MKRLKLANMGGGGKATAAATLAGKRTATMIKASDIKPDDRVQLESGEWVTVIETSNGKRPGSTLVEWKRKPGECGGFSLQTGEQIAVQRAKATAARKRA